MKKLLVDRGLASVDEIASGRSAHAPKPGVRTIAAADVSAALLRGSPSERAVGVPARFMPGDTVRAKVMHPPTHTRLPRYCRGRRGTIVATRGVHVFPDTNALGQGEHPQWLYTVRFDAAELWGADTTASAVYVDCWESYLEEVERA